MRAIADTGFLVALARSADKHHAWAAALSEHVTEPLLTCDAVLAETAFHLRSSRLVLEMVETELVRVAFESAPHTSRLAALADQFEDRRPDFADLCLIRMSELNPKHVVITIDRKDFLVYRRNGRERIPLLTPADG
jgi:predicted nucleic acid-binding protein